VELPRAAEPRHELDHDGSGFWRVCAGRLRRPSAGPPRRATMIPSLLSRVNVIMTVITLPKYRRRCGRSHGPAQRRDTARAE
jgi:hypothetical protein